MKKIGIALMSIITLVVMNQNKSDDKYLKDLNSFVEGKKLKLLWIRQQLRLLHYLERMDTKL